ncbi:MAG: O-antigen ligase family protein [SAR324 cluster bacterium]|nr:O-antigen ligase family protein [SAR324 cluster bacterium]
MASRISSTARFLVYALFFFSTFSMAAVGGVSMALYLLFFAACFFFPDWRQLKIPLIWPVLALIGSAFISGLSADFSWEAVTPLREFWRFFLPFVVWKSFDGIKSDRLLKIFLFMLVLVSIYGIVQYFEGVDWFRGEGHKKITPYAPDGLITGVFHAKGNFSHHLTYAHYLLLAFPLFLSLGCRPLYSWPLRLGMIAGSFCMLGGLFLSLGRSAWLGALAALAVLALQLPKKWLIALGIFIVIVGTAAVPFLNIGSSFNTYQQSIETPLKARFDSMLTSRHHRDRFFLWESAGLAIRDHFWLGIGLNNDEQIMPAYRKIVGEQYHHHTFLNKASAGVHNIYLQTWLNFGLIGLLCYFWFWGTVLKWNFFWIRAAKKQFPFEKALLWGMQAGFAGFMVGGVFENSLRDGETQTLLFALIGWSLHLGKHIEKSPANSSLKNKDSLVPA